MTTMKGAAIIGALSATALATACGADMGDSMGEPEGQLRQAAKKIGAMSTPILTVADTSAVTIDIRVCAGSTGAPAGLSLQWMTAEDFASFGNTWPAYTEAQEFCKASFGGNANLSRFALAPNACTVVEIGNLFDEEPGVSFTCNDDLACGTEYVFRAFAHATSTLNRSAYTPNLLASTLACTTDDGCTFTQGYWKNHYDAPGWPVESLTLGAVSYSATELLAIFDTPAKGNGLLSLAHQLTATKLNLANGADPAAISGAVGAADALIGPLVVPPIGSGALAPSVTSSLTSVLDAFNTGATGPGHCDDQEETAADEW